MNLNHQIIDKFMGDVLRDPKKLYFLLNLAGFSAIDAQKFIWNLRYAKIRSSDLKVRGQLLSFLTNLIKTLTSDPMLYSRFKALAIGGKLGPSLRHDVTESAAGIPIGSPTTATIQNAVAMSSLQTPPFKYKVRKKRKSGIHEEAQGVTGTGLGVPFTGGEGETNGIASFDPVLFGAIQRRYRKRKKHHRIKRFPL